MAQVVIETPILNSPFEEPTRHFHFSDDGTTDTDPAVPAARGEV
jgi:type III restriction enzyme